MRHLAGLLLTTAVVTAGLILALVSTAGFPVTVAEAAGAGRARSCPLAHAATPILAVTARGTLVALDPDTLRVEATLDSSVLPAGGLSIAPGQREAYVSAPGPGGRPAVWALQPARCVVAPDLVAASAELPSVSPDGGHLSYVTLDRRGRQDGVAVVAIDRAGRPDGMVRRLRTASVPPPLPIEGLALGPHATTLAVWGGFVDSYLGPKRPTVGTLDPATATSIAHATPVFDGEGLISPVQLQGPGPRISQRSPLYLPNGQLLVGGGDGGITMPFTPTTSGGGGGGIRDVVRKSAPTDSLAAGPDAALAWVGSGGRLVTESGVMEFPYGPAAKTAISTASLDHPAPTRTANGRYRAVAWTPGTDKTETTLPPPTVAISGMPELVGLPEATAVAMLKQYGIPITVRTQTDSSVPPGTVLTETPPAGYGVSCKCTIRLVVSAP